MRLLNVNRIEPIPRPQIQSPPATMLRSTTTRAGAIWPAIAKSCNYKSCN